MNPGVGRHGLIKQASGRGMGFAADLDPAEHPRQFTLAAGIVQQLHRAAGDPFHRRLADPVVGMALGRHLGQVGDAQHLAGTAELGRIGTVATSGTNPSDTGMLITGAGVPNPIEAPGRRVKTTGEG